MYHKRKKSYGYGGTIKQRLGGTVGYGIGGAIANVVGNAMQGKKLGEGLFEGTVKSLTPWGTVAGFGNLAEGVGQKYDKPGLEKVGSAVETGANVIGGTNAKLAGTVLQAAGVPGGKQMGNMVSSLYGGGAGGAGATVMPGGAAGGGAPAFGNFAGGAPQGGQDLMNMIQGFGGAGGAGGQGGQLLNLASNFLEAGGVISAENGTKTPTRRGTDPNKVMWGARGVTYDPNVDYNPYDASMQFQEGQMVREGRGPAEQGLTRDQFAIQRMGYDMMPLPPLDKEGNIYETNPHARKQIMERRARGGSPMQGSSQQVEYDLMDYEERIKEINDAYADYFNRRSVVEPKNPQYSFREGEGGEGGTLTIENAQRQFNGGAVSNNKEMMKTNMAYGGTPRRGVKLMKRGGGVYADNGTKTPMFPIQKEPTDPKEPYDGRSYFQRFADEAGQVLAGLGGSFDSIDRQSERGIQGMVDEKSVFEMLSKIPSDFMKAYLEQEETDRAREESGQSGRVDAFGDAVAAFSRGLEGKAPAKIGGPETTSIFELTPLADAEKAYERSRMTQEARNASRQFAGGRAPVRLMKRR